MAPATEAPAAVAEGSTSTSRTSFSTVLKTCCRG